MVWNALFFIDVTAFSKANILQILYEVLKAALRLIDLFPQLISLIQPESFHNLWVNIIVFTFHLKR